MKNPLNILFAVIARVASSTCRAAKKQFPISISSCGLMALALLAAPPSRATAEILVYDENTVNHLAATAAAAISPTRVVGNAATCNVLLTSQGWTAVLIDDPSTIPTGGWQPTINYINSGGRVAMSFWDWDNSAGYGSPGLLPAFGISSATGFSLNGRTLTDAGTTSLFSGVSMPNSQWNDHWGTDGGGFTFTLASGTIGMANLSGVTGTVMALGNSSHTIGAFLIDEAGNTWLSNGSGARLWENMYAIIVPEPHSLSLLAVGIVFVAGLALRRRRANT